MTFNYNQAKLLLFYYIVSSSSMDELHNPINNNRERERERARRKVNAKLRALYMRGHHVKNKKKKDKK